MTHLETRIRALTTPINGQLPRPWMTDLADPSAARVFVVGYNQATRYLPSATFDHERHIDAHFNRNGQSCRALYAEMTGGSPTRGNIEWFSEKLADAGVSSVLETNVVCYGSGSKSELARQEHEGGKQRGMDIFRYLLAEIRPAAIVVHGKGVADEVSRSLRLRPRLPAPPACATEFAQRTVPLTSRTLDPRTRDEEGWSTEVFVIPSLALPGFQNWPPKPRQAFCHWADAYLTQVAARVAAEVLRSASARVLP